LWRDPHFGSIPAVSNKPVAKANLIEGLCQGPEQAAEKGLIPGGKWHEDIPQGLKPIDFIGFIGTTEVAP
jgi:hypothetical protein